MTGPVTVTDRTGLGQVLRQLKLSGMLATLDARLTQAAAGELGHLEFLQVLCEDEVTRRASVSLAKRIRRAAERGGFPDRMQSTPAPWQASMQSIPGRRIARAVACDLIQLSGSRPRPELRELAGRPGVLW